jgi:hypothetical protein
MAADPQAHPMTEPKILVSPNIAGEVSLGDYNFQIHSIYGAVVFRQARARVKLRGDAPRPPRPAQDFAGRRAELAELERRSTAGGQVIVHGPDGWGKSALVAQLVNGLAARSFPHGIVWLEGREPDGRTVETDDLAQQVFDAVYDSEPPFKVTAATARPYLDAIRPILVVDDYAGSPADLEALAGLAPQGLLLVTKSAEPVSGTPAAFRLRPLGRVDAVRMLATRLAAAGARAAELDSICHLMGDIPLAVTVVANTIRELGLHLRQSADLLAGLHVSDPLARAYEFARLNLTSTERSLVAIAANSPGGSVDPDWLRTAANEPARFDEALMRVQSMELLTTQSRRLRLAPGLRPFAQLGPGDRDDLMQRLSQYLLEHLLVRESDFDYCSAELGNILGAIDWAVGKGHWRLALDLGQAIDPFLILRGRWETWRWVLEQVLSAARGKHDRAAEAWALHQLGARAIGLGLMAAAVDHLRQALGVRQSLGDTTAAACTQQTLDLVLAGV